MLQVVGGRAKPSIFFDSATNAKRGGRRRVSVGGKPPDCVKYRRSAAASALSPTVSTLSSLFRDIMCLIRSGLVRTFLLEWECRDVAGNVRPDSSTGVMISAEETKEVLVRLGGGGGGILAKENRLGGRRAVIGRMDPPTQLGSQG